MLYIKHWDESPSGGTQFEPYRPWANPYGHPASGTFILPDELLNAIALVNPSWALRYDRIRKGWRGLMINSGGNAGRILAEMTKGKGTIVKMIPNYTLFRGNQVIPIVENGVFYKIKTLHGLFGKEIIGTPMLQEVYVWRRKKISPAGYFFPVLNPYEWPGCNIKGDGVWVKKVDLINITTPS